MAGRVRVTGTPGEGSTGAEGEGGPTLWARHPLAAVLAILGGAAAIVGYSTYRLPSAYAAYRHCVPLPPTGHCPYASFWGFSPKFYFLAAIVGIVAGALLAVLATALWFRPRDHEMIGVFVLSVSTVSVLAYGGAFVGLAAGAAGGLLAILYRPPRFRHMARWSGLRPGRPGEDDEPESGTPGKTGATGPPPPLSADAYAPLPRVWRPFSVVAPTRTAEPPPRLPRFATISEALASQLGSEAPEPLPSPTARPAVPPPPPPPGATAVAPGTSPPPPHPTGPPPARPRAAPPAVPPLTAAEPSAPTGPAAGSVPPAPTRLAWKCSECGLTNAPWSRNCTRCQTPAPAT